nr:MAG TPA: hypothetical protein [Caudoviricetes sp.]
MQGSWQFCPLELSQQISSPHQRKWSLSLNKLGIGIKSSQSIKFQKQFWVLESE